MASKKNRKRAQRAYQSDQTKAITTAHRSAMDSFLRENRLQRETVLYEDEDFQAMRGHINRRRKAPVKKVRKPVVLSPALVEARAKKKLHNKRARACFAGMSGAEIAMAITDICRGENLEEHVPEGVKASDKGKYGLALENICGLVTNNDCLPDLGRYELKTTTVLWDEKLSQYKVKNALKITTITPSEVQAYDFEEHALHHKMRHLIIVMIEEDNEGGRYVVGATSYKLADNPLHEEYIKKDYLHTKERLAAAGMAGLTSRDCNLVQAKTNDSHGRSDGQTRRSFYCIPPYVELMLNLPQNPNRRRVMPVAPEVVENVTEDGEAVLATC